MESSVVVIESLDQEGRGIAHVEGKVVFIDGALTGELRSDSGSTVTGDALRSAGRGPRPLHR